MRTYFPRLYGTIAGVAMLLVSACGGGDDALPAPPQTPPGAVSFQLSLQIAGAGTVTSQPAGINCTTNCNANFAQGTALTLTATPGAGQSFTGWTGACTGTSTCVVTLDQARAVGTTFAPTAPQVNYSFALGITGNGAVTSQPAGINCTTNCSTDFAQGTVLTLTAAPGAGHSFTEWTGACTGTSSCVVTMDQARAVGTTFTPVVSQPNYGLALTIAGSGAVTSQPAGINCPTTCSADFPAGTVLTLSAAPASGQSFAGWTGACTGAAASCSVTLSQARSVSASFSPVAGVDFALNVTASGGGTVMSAPVGIACGSTCSANFPAGTAVVLTAAPAAGQVFASWGGACSGSLPTCSLQLTQARTAQAVFTAAPAPVQAFQAPQLLETSNDFNVSDTGNFGTQMRIAVNRQGDAMALWEQGDGPTSVKVYSRRYQASTAAWQPAVVVPGVSSARLRAGIVSGKLHMDDAGVVTWIDANFATRRHAPATGWGAAFSPPNLRVSQDLTDTAMDGQGNITAVRSGSDVEINLLPAGGQWGSSWTRLDTAGNLVSNQAKVALSSNGTALAVWRESNPGDSNYSLKSARYTPTGGWSAPESIETLFTTVVNEPPALAMDAQGNGTAMWLHSTSSKVMYNLYRAGSGWQGAVEVAGQSTIAGAQNIQLVMLPDGRATAVWSEGSVTIGTWSTMQYNPATGWAAQTTLTEYNPFDRDLRMDGNGNAVIVYQRSVPFDVPADLVSRRLSFGGAWSAPAIIDTGAGAGSLKSSRFVMNPSGQGAVIWAQDDVANSNARNSLWSAVLR